MSMAKFDKNALANKIKSGSHQASADITARLERAEALVKKQPTGFTEIPQAANPAPSASATFTRESAGATSRPVYFAQVPVENIDPNPFNARQIYHPERVKEMATSILASGQLMPGLATKRDGRTVLAAGHYRWKGIKSANLPFMNLMIHEGLTDQELYEISFKENDERTAQSALDNALSWKRLLDDRIYLNESGIAEATGISLPNINKTLAILRLSEPTLEFVRQKPEQYALSALYELVLLERVAGADVAMAMARKLSAEEAGRKEVAELRAQYENPKPRKTKENSRQYKIHIDGQPAGFIKEWDSGKVVVEVNLVEPAARESLVAELKARFNLIDNK
jgi:ParB family chromosome partitioning protein